MSLHVTHLVEELARNRVESSPVRLVVAGAVIGQSSSVRDKVPRPSTFSHTPHSRRISGSE